MHGLLRLDFRCDDHAVEHDAQRVIARTVDKADRQEFAPVLLRFIRLRDLVWRLRQCLQYLVRRFCGA